MSTRTARASSPGPGPGSTAWPRPVRPRLPGWLAYRLQWALAPNSAYRWLADRMTRSSSAYRAFTATERAAKGVAFGCRMCGQCTPPDEVDRRLRAVPAGQVAEEGTRICAEIIEQVRAIPGVSGVHIMAPGYEHGIPGILERAGLARRDPVVPAPTLGGQRAH